MKLLFLSIFISLNFVSTIQVHAQACSSTTDPKECNDLSGCSWSGTECLDSNPTIEPWGQFSESVDTYNDAIGIKNDMSTGTLGDIINALLPYLLTGAGIILFGMLIMGGFTMLTAVSDPKKAEAGKARITAAIIGFLIIFCAYWITQILEIILGITIL